LKFGFFFLHPTFFFLHPHNFKNPEPGLDLLFGKGNCGGVCYGFINPEVNIFFG